MKSKKTKRALISSVLALVLCFVMLLGTTFAWFTDTASTKVNTIQAGKLDVALEDEDGNSLENGILSWQKNEQGKGQEVLWEPGATYNLQNVVIKNNGNLALKYKVVISGIEGDAKLNEAIDWTISTVRNVEGEEETPEIDTQAEGEESAAPTTTPETTTTLGDGEYYLLPDEEATLTISGTMKKEAGNEYQGLSIDGVAITVYATQYTYEYDSTTDQYDKDANFDFAWDGDATTAPEKDENGVYHITSAAEFVNYINAIHVVGSDYKTVVLDADIDLGGYTIEVSGEGYAFSGSFDGQNHTVSNYVIKRTDGKNYTGLFSCYDWNGASVKNLTVKNGTVISNGAQVSAIIPSLNTENGVVDNCHAINCTVIGEKKVGAITGYVAYGTVSNCTATDCSVYASDNRKEQATVFGYDNGGTFTNNTPTNVTVNYNTGTVTTISTKAELFDFAESVNVSMNSYDGQTVVLTADIDLGNTPWTPIGKVENHNNPYFQGTFDGNGHTIYNLYVNKTAAAEELGYSTAGLFGWIDTADATIKNLTIDGATVKGNHFTGAVVGYMTGTIDNCHVKNATIVSKHLDGDNCGDKAGGVVGILNSNTTVKNCSVSDSTITAARDAGQVIGCLNGQTQSGNSATNVTVTADTTGCNHSGAGSNITNGIVGRTITN